MADHRGQQCGDQTHVVEKNGSQLDTATVAFFSSSASIT